jgi:hypothetical protein
MTELEIDSLLREYMSGRPVGWSREADEGQIRQALLEYAALCTAHGDQVRASIARRAVEDLDRRYNFAE